ncbi:MAG: excalibur calcium-binding domain-containing protein [Hyphomonas sp.]|nr:excalibur calcium-binding domain-containing protein [Hyphomonas sp.]
MVKKETWRGFVAVGLALTFAAPALGHGGGLNSEGCHNNRKIGDYHCHRSSYSPPPPPPSAYIAPQRAVPDTAAEPKRTGTWSYTNCSEARAAGKAPVYAWEEGYGPHLDRDNDGVGCE